MDGERSGVRDDGGPEASAGRYLDLRRAGVFLLLRRVQGVVRSDSREVREVTSSPGGDSPAKVYANQGSSRAVESGQGPSLWSRFTWSRALFAVLLLNLVWTASLFICPFTVPPGSFVNQVGGANLVDHEAIWETFPLYARVVYTIGDAQCHQLWYRSFMLNGNQMPIDERMTSMYLFANLGLLATIFARPSTSTGQVMLNALPEFLRRRLARLGVDRAGALVIARRKRKDEPTDWVAPDFDEVGYMRTEIQAAKTAVLTIAWAAVGAIVSFLLYSVNAALAFFAGIGVAFGLYYVLPYLGIAVKGFKRRDWTGHGITYFFSWLAFWILLLNPPFGDFTTPTIQAISVSPVHTGYTGYLSCLPLVGGAVTVPLTLGNDSVYVLFRA